jgi:cellulose synthase (UDP-forming)
MEQVRIRPQETVARPTITGVTVRSTSSNSDRQQHQHERLTRFIAATSLAVSSAYIVWRWGWTLNLDALWFSIPLALAETYGLVIAGFMTFTAWSLKQRTSPPAPAGTRVDVFVTTYDEPLTVIRKTALGARGITYPHNTYILDDGHRPEVEALAAELGIGYLRRNERTHAKAGNLNHALAHTNGEFILQLDADHYPLPNIIDRLLGFFADARVAFVQSPQDFYNTDAFTYDVNERARRIWEDQQLFFRVLQPGKDRVGAAFFVGSCAILRRSALDEVGGFATGTITEDIETSLLLHSRGWKSVYLNETLAYGLAPASAMAFHIQHLRWGQGAMQALRKYRPLTMPGLTLAQRVAYLDSLTTYLGGFQRLILYLAPLVFFFTGAFPLRTSAATFAAVFLPYIVLQFLSFKMLARGHGSWLLADRYGMAKFFTHLLAITGFRRRPLRFNVTPKGAADVPFRTYAPQLALVVLTIVAVAWAVWVEYLADPYEVPGWGASAFWVNLAFAIWNAAVAGWIVRMSIRMRQKRADHRFAEELPIFLRLRGHNGEQTRHLAVTQNLNPYGLALRCMQPLELDSTIDFELPLSTREVRVSGRIVHQHSTPTEYGPVHIYGVQFNGVDWHSRDAIELHCAQHAMPLGRQRYDESGASISAAFRRFSDDRRERRVRVGVAAHILAGPKSQERELGIGVIEEVSGQGARVVTDHPIAPKTLIRLRVPNRAQDIDARVVFMHALETTLGTRFLLGLDTRVPRLVQPSEGPLINAAKPKLQIIQGAKPMEKQAFSVPGPAPREDAHSLITIRGKTARLSGTFEIEDSIEIQCELEGELIVGGQLIIGKSANVTANVRAANVIVYGGYSGNMTASGSVEIAVGGVLTGNVESAELIVPRGAFFTGSAARPKPPGSASGHTTAAQRPNTAAQQPAQRTAAVQPGPAQPAAGAQPAVAAQPTAARPAAALSAQPARATDRPAVAPLKEVVTLEGAPVRTVVMP